MKKVINRLWVDKNDWKPFSGGWFLSAFSDHGDLMRSRDCLNAEPDEYIHRDIAIKAIADAGYAYTFINENDLECAASILDEHINDL